MIVPATTELQRLLHDDRGKAAQMRGIFDSGQGWNEAGIPRGTCA